MQRQRQAAAGRAVATVAAQPMAGALHLGETRSRTTQRHHRGLGHFLRHLGEMTLAMMLGMAVLGAGFRAALTGMGFDYERAAIGWPAVSALVMAFSMSVPMVLWMRYRRHSWSYTAEMAAAMFVPVLALIPLFWLGIISDDALSGIQHAAMIPSMLVVMLRRRREMR